MANCVKNCGECLFFESFFKEFENSVGIVEKGKCHKWNQDEIWGTKAPCNYVQNKSIEELAKES